MCVVSMVMDHYREKWYPLTPGGGTGVYYPPVVTTPTITIQPAISAEEIAEFRRLLERAREYDKRNNEPECELQEKKDAIKKIADQLGVDISFV